MPRPFLCVPACALALLTAMLVGVPTSAASAASGPARATDRQVGFTRWEGGPAFQSGTRSGTRPKKGVLVLKAPDKARRYRGTRYDVGTWTSAPVAPGFAFTELVASWSATTPRNSWVEVRVRATGTTTGRWLVLGRWASSDKHVRRTSVPDQSDAVGRVDVDTWKASGAGATSYQLQVRLMRRAGASSASPSVSALGAVASRLP